MTSAAPEPTDEQYKATHVVVLGWGMDDGFPALVESVARALAAAVAAERERLRHLIDDLIVDNGLGCQPHPSNNPCQCSTARAIREVSR